jgi:hypothetical protein
MKQQNLFFDRRISASSSVPESPGREEVKGSSFAARIENECDPGKSGGRS